MLTPRDDWDRLLAAANSATTDADMLSALKAIQRYMDSLEGDLTALRRLRRKLTVQLQDSRGWGTKSWIAKELGMTPQAVDSFLRFDQPDGH